MHDLRYYKVMADYNYWVNIKIYSVCAEMPEAKRLQNLGGAYESLHGALNHILCSDRLWLARFEGKSPDAQQDSQQKQSWFDNFQELRHEREKTDQQIQAWVNNLSVDWLKQPFSYTDPEDGKTLTLPAWILAVHLFNHQTHHRGQITTLLHQLGCQYGTTDLPWLPSLQAAE